RTARSSTASASTAQGLPRSPSGCGGIGHAAPAASSAPISARTARARTPPPLLAKVGPDLDEAALADIAEVALESGLDGLIIGNTTVTRPAGLRSPDRRETGGLSGAPLAPLAAACLAKMYRLVGSRLPIIGCG